LHDLEDEDDLSTGKEKFARVHLRKMMMALEDDHEQQRRFRQSPKT
jgi:hypothetical protein